MASITKLMTAMVIPILRIGTAKHYHIQGSKRYRTHDDSNDSRETYEAVNRSHMSHE